MAQIQIWNSGEKIKGDRFEIIKVLGKGGFGITYLAKDEKRQQQVVIKTLNATQQGELDFTSIQEKFVNEGMTLATFDHPHIVKIYELIHVGSLWGLVMEYIPGQDLTDYILERGQLHEDEALGYIDQVAQALDFVHQRKIFHRDVKPHNIMLRQRQAVLIDFGIAKEYAEQQTIYLSNSLGTELYKPIEQYEQSGRFGPYTDIYALAVTLYHLVTGNAPGGGSPLYTSRARKDAQDKGWGANLDDHLWGELVKAGISDRTRLAIQAGMQIEANQRPQNMTEFRELLGLVKSVIVLNSEDLAKKYLDAGTEFYCAGDYQAAISEIDRAIELNPQNAVYYYHRGYAKSRAGDYEGAVDDLTEAIELNPQDAIYYYHRGYIKYNFEYYRGAVADYTKAIELDPRSAIYYADRGEVKCDLKDYEGAIADYTKAIELDPQKPAYCFGLDIAREKIQCKETIVEHVKTLIDSDIDLKSDEDIAYDSRGIKLHNSEDYKGAIAQYTKAIELNPLCANYYNSRGVSAIGLNLYQKAVDDFSKAIELDSIEFVYWYYRGSTHFLLNQHSLALIDLNKAIELNSESSTSYFKRGVVRNELRDYHGAIEDLDLAIKLDTNYVKAYYHRGLVHKKLKDYPSAIKDLDIAIKLEPDNIQFHEIRDSIVISSNFSEFVSLEDYNGTVLTAVFLDKETIIASGRDINTVRKWDAGGKTRFMPDVCITNANAHLSLSAVFSKDKNFLATGEHDNEIKIWDINKGKLIKVFEGLNTLNSCLAFAPNAENLAIGCMDNTVFLLSLKITKISVGSHADNVKSIAFSPDGNYIASGSKDRTIKLWETDNMQNILTLSGHGDAVMSLAFSPDGNYIASGSADGDINLWEVETGELIRTFEGNGVVKALAFQPSTNVLASGGFDKKIRLWDLDSEILLTTLTGHQDHIYSLEFSSDGQILVSASGDKTVKLWGNSDTLHQWNVDIDSIPF